MAQYDATYACGHCGTVRLYGKEEFRRSRLAHYATVDCPDCKRAAKADAEQAAVAQAATEAGDLPALNGTEKQITWAETIRAPIALRIAELRRDLATKAANADDDRAALMLEAARVVLKQRDVRYWIDHRTASVVDRLQAAVTVIVRNGRADPELGDLTKKIIAIWANIPKKKD